MNEEVLTKIEGLLTNVGNKINESKKIAKLKGENFNIFSILGVESNENKTHSKFLASLLNPDGGHGMGDAFLRLFIKTVLLKHQDTSIFHDSDKTLIDVSELNLNSVSVATEKYLGNIDLRKTKGGRVDILIEEHSKTWAILIENKIYAGDQDLQIARYCNYNIYKNKVVYYLTLFGVEPTKKSTKSKEVDKDFFPISYKTDVKNWLEKCQKEAADYPILRETIKQYLILIKKLTGQLTIQNDMKAIIETIKKDYETASVIANNLHESKKGLLNDLFLEIEKSLQEKLNNELTISYEGFENKWQGFIIAKKSWNGVRLGWSGNPFILTSQTVLGIIAGRGSDIRNQMKNREENSKHIDLFSTYKYSTDGWMAFRTIYLNDNYFCSFSSDPIKSAQSYVDEFIHLASIIDELIN